MGPNHRTARATLSALLPTTAAALALLSSGSPATAAPSAPTPHLGLSWTVIEHRCWTVTRKVRVRHGKKIVVEHKRARVCGDRPVKDRRRALHLRWQQHGEVFGHLTLAGKPIADATIAVAWTDNGNWHSGSYTLTTNTQGRFSAEVDGPSNTETISYSPSPGDVIAVQKHIAAAAHLTFHVGHLRAGRDATFSGVVAGGYWPTNLNVQLLYWAGRNGWQSVGSLAPVNAATGAWSTTVSIPTDSAHYLYRLKATVKPNSDWPWAYTDSGVVVRRVA